MEFDEEIERRVVGRQGPSKKPFSELGAVQKRRVSQPVLDSLNEVAESRMMDPTKLSGYLLRRYSAHVHGDPCSFHQKFRMFYLKYRVSYSSNKVLAETGKMIEDGESVAALRRLNPEHCLFVMTVGEGIGKFQWT